MFSNYCTDLYSQEILIETPTFLLVIFIVIKKTKLCYLNVESERLRRDYGAKLWPEYVMGWLNVKEIENRPEPPWVKRQQSDEGLIFTD